MRAALSITAGVWAAGAAMAAGPTLLEGDGFSVTDGARAWSRWQARVAVGSSASALRYPVAATDDAGLKWRGVSVMGDYYFSPSLAVRPGGFRATSGLLVGTRSSAWQADAAGSRGASALDRAAGGLQAVAWPVASGDPAAAEWAAVPYVGIGYTGALARGGLSFSADLGLMAIGSASAVKLGRALGGAQSLDDTLREMRLSPVLQLGVSYSF